MKAKKELICKSAFLSLLKSRHSEPVVTLRVVHQKEIKNVIYKALITQFILKVFRLNKINFQILYMVWR